MKQFFCLKLKKLFFRKSGLDRLSDKLQDLERQIGEIKLQISDPQMVRIEKIVVEKIICEKIETSYRIDSVATENLSGTMNIGTVYPGPGREQCAFDRVEKPPVRPQPRGPKVNITY
ncbi:MAG TPA: hypothetical protein PK728_11940 [Bacillota bacterium]|nr:hypothetical protein [Bacillota bacterium]